MHSKRRRINKAIFFGLLVFVPLIYVILPGICLGRTLSFEDVLEQVIAKSYDIRMAEIDTEITKHKLTEAKAGYFPSLSVRLNDEYTKDLTDQSEGIISVGETVINTDASGYQNSLSFYANYNLFDFGAREMQYRNAARDMEIAGYSVMQQLSNLKIDTLMLFKKGLILHKRIQAQTTIMQYKTRLYELSKRLHKAGTLGKIDVTGVAIEVAEAAQDLDSLRLDWEGILEELTYYTGKTYTPGETDFNDFIEPEPVEESIDVMDMPAIRIYDIAIEKKKAEYHIVRTEWLPKFNLYSSYQFYGSDSSSFSRSFEDMKEGNFIVGAVVDLNLFRGFGDYAKARQVKAELRKLEVEREKEMAEQRKVLNTLRENVRLYREQSERWDAYEDDVYEKSHMAERLTNQKLRDQLYFLREQIETIERRLEIDLKNIERIASHYHLQFMAEGSN